MSGAGEGWDSTVSSWARSRADIRALVQIGSRVQPGAAVDDLSDYDYHLITTNPTAYRDGGFARELGRCWASGAQVAFGGAVKVSAVYEGGLEADFVVLRHADVLMLSLALRWPATARFWPSVLRRGVEDFRTVAAPGWKVVKGGAPWERRYARVTPFRAPLAEPQFRELCGEFWTQLAWAAKRALRGELRASERALHRHLVENSLRMLQEEALLSGRPGRPLGRRAEGWLTGEQLRGTDFASRPDRAALLAALARIADVFADSSAAVAARNGWAPADHGELRAWLRSLPLT